MNHQSVLIIISSFLAATFCPITQCMDTAPITHFSTMSFTGSRIQKIKFHPHKNIVVFQQLNECTLYNLDTKKIGKISPEAFFDQSTITEITSMDISPDGAHIVVTKGETNQTLVYNTSSLQVVWKNNANNTHNASKEKTENKQQIALFCSLKPNCLIVKTPTTLEFHNILSKKSKPPKEIPLDTYPSTDFLSGFYYPHTMSVHPTEKSCIINQSADCKITWHKIDYSVEPKKQCRLALFFLNESPLLCQLQVPFDVKTQIILWLFSKMEEHRVLSNKSFWKDTSSQFIDSVQHSHDGKYLITIDILATNSLAIYKTKELTISSQNRSLNYFYSVAFHPNNKTIVTQSTDGKIVHFFDLETGKEIYKYQSNLPPYLYIARYKPLAFNKEGTLLAVGYDNNCRFYKLSPSFIEYCKNYNTESTPFRQAQ